MFGFGLGHQTRYTKVPTIASLTGRISCSVSIVKPQIVNNYSLLQLLRFSLRFATRDTHDTLYSVLQCHKDALGKERFARNRTLLLNNHHSGVTRVLGPRRQKQ